MANVNCEQRGYTSLVVSLLCFTASLQIALGISCAQCESEKSGLTCLMKPPRQTKCPDDFKYCMTAVVFNEQDRMSSFSRGCSPRPFKDGCQDGAGENGSDVSTVCYATCARNGCNAKHSLPYLVSLMVSRR